MVETDRDEALEALETFRAWLREDWPRSPEGRLPLTGNELRLVGLLWRLRGRGRWGRHVQLGGWRVIRDALQQRVEG